MDLQPHLPRTRFADSPDVEAAISVSARGGRRWALARPRIVAEVATKLWAMARRAVSSISIPFCSARALNISHRPSQSSSCISVPSISMDSRASAGSLSLIAGHVKEGKGTLQNEI